MFVHCLNYLTREKGTTHNSIHTIDKKIQKSIRILTKSLKGLKGYDLAHATSFQFLRLNQQFFYMPVDKQITWTTNTTSLLEVFAHSIMQPTLHSVWPHSLNNLNYLDGSVTSVLVMNGLL